MPLPTRRRVTRLVNSSRNGSTWLSCTNMRLGEMQACPVFRNLTAAAPLAAWTGSASLKTMNGAWPPSSAETRFMFAAALPTSILPTAVEPVKVILRTSGLVQNSSPMGFGSRAVTRLITPSGTPASIRHLKVSMAQSGVASAGLRTMVQPAASAGAILRVSMLIG